jgi:hypothetical protein
VVGTDGLGPLSDSQPNNDGPDGDGDGLCDAGDLAWTVTLDFAGRPMLADSIEPERQWRLYTWKEDGFTIRVIPDIWTYLPPGNPYENWPHEMGIVPGGSATCGGEESLSWWNIPACAAPEQPPTTEPPVVIEITHDSGASFDVLSFDSPWGVGPLLWEGSDGTSVQLSGGGVGSSFSFGSSFDDITSVTFLSGNATLAYIGSNVIDDIVLDLNLEEVPGPTAGTFIDETFDPLHGDTDGWLGFFAILGTASITLDNYGAESPRKVYGTRITPGTYEFTLDVSEAASPGQPPLPTFVPDFMMNGASPDQIDTSDTDLSDGALWSFSFEVSAGDPIVGEQLHIVFGIPPELVSASPTRAYELHQFTGDFTPLAAAVPAISRWGQAVAMALLVLAGGFAVGRFGNRGSST